jgi:hypothetical protein
MYKELARARMLEMEADAQNLTRVRRLRAATKWQRRAESATRRARLARDSLR